MDTLYIASDDIFSKLIKSQFLPTRRILLYDLNIRTVFFNTILNELKNYCLWSTGLNRMKTISL